eukprot:6212967-Pleurochrysis_carterae.AAC.1
MAVVKVTTTVLAARITGEFMLVLECELNGQRTWEAPQSRCVVCEVRWSSQRPPMRVMAVLTALRSSVESPVLQALTPRIKPQRLAYFSGPGWPSANVSCGHSARQWAFHSDGRSACCLK